MTIRRNKDFTKTNPNYDQAMKVFWYILLLICIVSLFINLTISMAFFIKALLIMITAVISSREAEILFFSHQKNADRASAKIAISETRPEITGLLIALLSPIGVPIFGVIITVFFSVFIVRNAFGGLTFNIFNAAIVGRIFMAAAWPVYMTSTLLASNLIDYILTSAFNVPEDTLSNAYLLKDFDVSGSVNVLFTNDVTNMLGAIPIIILLPLGIYLLVKKYCSYIIPLTTMITIMVISLIMSNFQGASFTYVVYNMTLGATVFAIFFLAVDPVTSPRGNYGKVIYGVLIAVVTMFIRILSTSIVGILFAILFANMLTPIINKKSTDVWNKGKIISISILIIFILGSSYFIQHQYTLILESESSEVSENV